MSLQKSCLQCWRVCNYFYRKTPIRRMSQKALDADPSWEAEILRHERLVNSLLKKDVTAEDLPKHKHEELLENLPHVAFRDEKLFQKDEELLDETTKVILGQRLKKGNYVDSSNVDPLMLRDDVMEILKRIHFRVDLDKVYKSSITKRKRMPTIKFYTDEQLQQARDTYKENAQKAIRMPLIMKERAECDEMLSHDEVLNGYEESNVTFVDISEDLLVRERFMLVREPSGVLRKANWEERDRLAQVYFPVPSRSIIIPSLFSEENMKVALENNFHENILNQCLVQFDPDSKEYIQTFEMVYEDIDAKHLYSTLRSTRYYGGMVLHLVKKKCIDGLVLESLNEETLNNAVDLISLFMLLHPNSKTNMEIEQVREKNPISVIKAYINSDSGDVKTHSLALQRFEEQAEKT